MIVTYSSFTSRAIAQLIGSVTHHSVYACTIQRRLQQSGTSAIRPLLGLTLTQNNTRLRSQLCHERRMKHHGEKMLNSSVMHRHTGRAQCIMVLGGIGYPSRTLLVHIAGTLKSQLCISEVLDPVVFPYLQIELLPWPARFPDLSPIENMWFMVSQRLTQITPPAATPDQRWQRVEAAWSAVPQENIQSIFESMPRCVPVVISNTGGYSGY
ncbi:transposable element Tcb1 transposase [Trichonephila clavipes]|uniref:Transposable element Tcb1 transposase n=1 Tax=Trichonephila clavipes TaxID=2585209 RepID=A0A8X6R9R3_TRICX|nr:transposable element Tcb1 transposase [Trichonephila clavipes]